MDWVNLILLLALVAGHTKLLVTVVNHVHGHRLHHRLLRQIRHLHDVLIPVFPIVLFWFVGIRGAGVLTGGSWSELHVGWIVYLTPCAIGAVGFIATVVGRRLRPIPKQQLSNHSRLVDIEKHLGYRPVGEGPFQFLTRIPGNEIFQVEVSEKEFRLPRLPCECDGLSILHVTDLHFIGTVDLPYFEEVMRLSRELEPDLIVFTGDLMDEQRLVEWLPATLGGLHAPLGCYFILGNHDWELDPDAIREALVDLGWKDAAGEVHVVDYHGRQLAIGGSEQPWMGTHPNFGDAPQDAFRLFLSHTPDNLRWAKQNSVDLMLSGHNHGGQVVLPLVGPIYSPSVYGCKYASGLFWEDPTLLYVSRGISARHPLRWNCPPELTKLVLRAAVDGASHSARTQSLAEDSDAKRDEVVGATR